MNGRRSSRVAPASLRSDSTGSSSASSFISRAWHKVFVPVEWRGVYSVDKLLGALTYRASSFRVWLVLVLTPLPALAACLLIERVLPLADPARGLRGNTMFLARTWLRAWLTSAAVDVLIELYIPVLRLPRRRLYLMNVVQGAVASAAVVAVAEIAGVFPTPFSPAVTMPVYARRDAATEGVMASVNFAVALIYVYNVFVTLFALTPARWQALLALALVAIKSFATQRTATQGDWRRAQRLLVSGQNDLATAHVAFGAQYFHALFVAACLQKATSLEMLATVVAFTLIYQLTTLCELKHHTARVAWLSAQLAPAAGTRTSERLRDVAWRWQRHVSALDPSEAIATSAILTEAWHGRQDAGRDHVSKMFEPLSPQECEYLEAVNVLFQCREATLLRLYVDMFVPLVFFAFVATIKFLPNGQYMPFLRTNDLGELALRLRVQLSVKVATFMLLLYTLKDDENDSPSGLQQLAFALERMALVVQAKSLFVALCVFDFSLLHNGNDLTFQFAWLRNTHNATESGT